MKTIYRYEINEAINDVELPIGAKILSVGISTDWKYADPDDLIDDTKVQIEKISIWALVDNEAGVETRRFLIFGTGANMDETETYNLTFIGTVRKSNEYAFHIFEVDR